MYSWKVLVLGCIGLAWLGQAGAADEKRTAVAKCVTETGTILRRESPGKEWQLVADKEALYTGDLLLAGTDAAMVSNNGAVKLMMVGGVGGSSPLPIIETAIKLNASTDVDLDFSFLRGRVDLVNEKTKGEAKVRVRGPTKSAEIRLVEPGTRVALVLFGRWAPGVPFRKDAKPEEHHPSYAFTLLVIKGEIEVTTTTHDYVMHAPPGPALLEADSIANEPHRQRLEKLPDWAMEKADSEEAKKSRAGLGKFRELVKTKSISEAGEAMLKSDNPVERRIALAIFGATDDLDHLAAAFATAQHPDVWQNGITVIRNWIGREPGQDMKLYQRFVDSKKLTPAQAETALNLLHNFSDDELRQPETYEGLIDMLCCEQVPIRGLAYWHLYRLVPAGRKIEYDPLAPIEKRKAAMMEWHKLVPPGKLPPSSK